MAVESPVQRRQHPAPTELLSLIFQGLLDSLVPNEDHHTPPGTQVHGEHWSIFLTQLGAGREGEGVGAEGQAIASFSLDVPITAPSLDEAPERNPLPSRRK